MSSEYQILRYMLDASYITGEKSYIRDFAHLNLFGILKEEEEYLLQLTMNFNTRVSCLVLMSGIKKDNIIHYNELQIKLFSDEFIHGRYTNYDISIDQGKYTDLELALIFSRRFKDTELTKNKDTLDFILDHLKDMT